jgi:hypothetical protein
MGSTMIGRQQVGLLAPSQPVTGAVLPSSFAGPWLHIDLAERALLANFYHHNFLVSNSMRSNTFGFKLARHDEVREGIEDALEKVSRKSAGIKGNVRNGSPSGRILLSILLNQSLHPIPVPKAEYTHKYDRSGRLLPRDSLAPSPRGCNRIPLCSRAPCG